MEKFLFGFLGQLRQEATDRLHHSLRAYREVNVLGGVDYIIKCSIKKPNTNNNRLEILNRTFRGRAKVQCGWKSHKSAIAEGQRVIGKSY